MKTQINAKILNAFAKIAKTNDNTREGLRQVFIKADENAVIYKVTNGHLAVVARELLPKDSETTFTPVETSIPLDICLALKPGKHAYENICMIEYSEEEKEFTLIRPVSRQSFSWLSQDTRQCPSIERVIPSNVTGEAGQFDPELISLCRDALASAHPDKTPPKYGHVHHNGPKAPAIITLPGVDGFAVIIPVTTKVDPSWSRPEWL